MAEESKVFQCPFCGRCTPYHTLIGEEIANCERCGVVFVKGSNQDEKHDHKCNTKVLEGEENQMKKELTIIQKVEAIKEVEQYRDDLKSRLSEIISDLFSLRARVDDFRFVGNEIDCDFIYYARGAAEDSFNIPIEWLKEGFDYMEAYKKLLEEDSKKLKQEVEQAEYNQYLKLKSKFENQGVSVEEDSSNGTEKD